MKVSFSAAGTRVGNRNHIIDIFRGMAVVLMIVVDAVPDFQAVYPELTHAPWEGIHVADLAFPGFVFAMGASAAFSWKGRLNVPLAHFFRKLVLRCGILFLLGLLMNAFFVALPMLFAPDFDPAVLLRTLEEQGRVFGVLQRLALTYGLGMIIARAVKTEECVFLSALVLLALSSFGYHTYAADAPFARTDNISRALDLLIPGEAHIYVHYGIPFDPEGLYGTINAAATMLFGLLAGSVLREEDGMWRKGMLLAFGGAVLMGSGQFWSDYDLVGKPLWTSPFVLLTAGADMAALAALVWFLALMPFAEGLFRPFLVFGRNPLFFYIMTNIGISLLWAVPAPSENIPMQLWLWNHTVAGLGGPAFSAVMYTILWCLLWWPAAEYLYRHGIILKI